MSLFQALRNLGPYTLEILKKFVALKKKYIYLYLDKFFFIFCAVV